MRKISISFLSLLCSFYSISAETVTFTLNKDSTLIFKVLADDFDSNKLYEDSFKITGADTAYFVSFPYDELDITKIDFYDNFAVESVKHTIKHNTDTVFNADFTHFLGTIHNLTECNFILKAEEDSLVVSAGAGLKKCVLYIRKQVTPSDIYNKICIESAEYADSIRSLPVFYIRRDKDSVECLLKASLKQYHWCSQSLSVNGHKGFVEEIPETDTVILKFMMRYSDVLPAKQDTITLNLDFRVEGCEYLGYLSKPIKVLVVTTSPLPYLVWLIVIAVLLFALLLLFRKAIKRILDRIRRGINVLKASIKTDAEKTLSEKKAEIEALKFEKASIKAEYEKTLSEKRVEIDVLKFEKASIKAESESILSEKRAEIETLKFEKASIKEESERTLSEKKAEIDALKSEKASIKDEAEKTLSEKKAEVDALKLEKASIKDEAEKTLSEKKAEIEALKSEKASIKAESEKTLSEKRAEIDALKSEKASIKAESEKTLSEKRAEIDALKSENNNLCNALTETKRSLSVTTKSLDAASQQIVQLKDNQILYINAFSLADYAKDYASKIKSLVTEVREIEAKSCEILGAKLNDPYFVFKAISKYTKRLDKIDLPKFFTEVELLSQYGLILNNGLFSGLEKAPNKEVLFKRCMFDYYLKGYLDAVTVLIESFIGMLKLVPDIPLKYIYDFEGYRDVIHKLASGLSIIIETVRLFDKIGSNIDLDVTLIDAGYDSGDILEIDNCIVYCEGEQRPDTKISVIAQS